jgi:hypothetical protein
MALSDAVRAGVSVARRLLSSGQVLASVTHTTYATSNEYDEPGTPTATVREGLVDQTARVLRDAQGVEVVATASVLFFADLAVDYHDTFSVDGVTLGRVVRVQKGVVPALGGAFVTEVFCG